MNILKSGAIVMTIVLSMAGCASAPPPAAVSELAPKGVVKAAINLGNPILASQDTLTGEPKGVSVDLARELARRLGAKLELVPFNSAGQVVEAVKANKVDIAFVAIDPLRAQDVSYSAAYVVIEGAYMVRNDSPLKSNDDVDKAGNRIVVGAGSAYDLFLSRAIKNATLVRAPSSPTVTDMFVAQKLEVAAGVKQQLEMDAKRFSGLRLLDGRFMVINQAMGTPRGREAGAKYLGMFIEEMKSTGFVAEALKRHNIEGAAVAPAAKP